MSLRGFKKSIPDTKAAHFKDRRSFRSIDGHDLLFGEDKRVRRCRIHSERNPDGISWVSGEWHHLRNEHNRLRRCDCPEGGLWVRKNHALREHVQVRLGRIR